MVTVKERKAGNQTYYYLVHTIRNGKESLKKEKYIGNKLPANIDELKKEFLSEIYKEKWYPMLNKIKENYSGEMNKTPKVAREKNRLAFSIRFTYDTQKIEGSTLTLRETSNLLEKGVTPKGKPVSDIKESEAHQKIFYEMLNYKKDLTLQIILYWHKKLFENTKPEISGKIREHQVLISGSKFTPPLPVEVYPMLTEFFRWYSKNKNKIHPVELASMVHLKLVTIHPFADGNGRISRLAMNFILHKYNCPLFNIPYAKRTSYYNALERSQTKKQEHIFVRWFSRNYVKENEGYLREAE